MPGLVKVVHDSPPHSGFKHGQNLPNKFVHQIQHALFQVCKQLIAWGKEKNFVDSIANKL
jgi:hypothetical protein